MNPRCPALVHWLTPEAIRYGRALARRICKNDADYDESDQEAVRGLLEALDRFDPEKVDHLGGWIYVTHYVRLYVRRACWRANAGPAYIPTNLRYKTKTFSAFSLSDPELFVPRDAHMYKASRYVESCEDEVEQSRTCAKVWEVARAVLTKRQLSIMLARHVQGLTLEQTSQQIGRSRERIRQIEEDAIYRIKRVLLAPSVATKNRRG